MKTVLAIFTGCCLTGRLLAGPAGSNSVVAATPELVWSAPTNDWPSSLWIYKVMPQQFSSAVISNLLAMASFTMADNLGTNGRWLYDLSDLNFETPDQRKHLWICQKYGYIEYIDQNAKAATDTMSIGVPSDEQAYPLGLDYLRKFGIDRSQLATRPSTNVVFGPNDFGIRRELGTRKWIDAKSHETFSDVTDRGIYFVRRIDGVAIDGIVRGGVFIDFGEHSRITELKITWRGLEPFELRPTLTPAQITDEIKQGHARWRPNPLNGPVRQITVTGFELFYRGQPGDADLDRQQRFVDPYVMIYASFGDGGTNEVKCYSEMPIFPSK